VSLLPYYFEFEKRDPISFKALISDISDEGVELLEAMLDLNPNKRISISEALKHPFFLRAQGEKNYTKKLAEMDIIEKFRANKK
jgi:serine/threonine protein kinase